MLIYFYQPIYPLKYLNEVLMIKFELDSILSPYINSFLII